MPARLHIAAFSLLTVLTTVATAGILAGPRLIEAAPGDLVPFFGTNGHLTTDFALGDDDPAEGFAQPDGKIVVVGTSSGVFSAVRYNADGTLDPSFSNDGIATYDFGHPGQIGLAGAPLPDGKILIAGRAQVNGINQALLRINQNGSLDTSFGNNGLVINFAAQEALDIVLQGDRIITAGAESAIVRYNANGTVDTTFGSGGMVKSGFFRTSGVALDSKGRIIATGATASFGNANDIFVARYGADGAPDPSFGSGGIVTTSLNGGGERGTEIVAQEDGKMVVSVDAALAPGGDFATGFVRYNEDGSLDGSFGAGGAVLRKIGTGGHDFVNSLTRLDNGRLIASGTARVGGQYHISAFMVSADGQPEASFADNGVASISIPGSFSTALNSLQQNERIVLVSRIQTPGSGADFGLVRLNLAGDLASAGSGFGSSGIVRTSLPGGNDSLRHLARTADGKILALGAVGPSSIGLVQYKPNGELDTGFGESGRIIFGPSGIVAAGGLAIQSNGKIVIVATNDFATYVRRYSANGILDTSFGDGGDVQFSFGDDTVVSSVVIDANDRIVIAGTSGQIEYDFAVARLLPDGDPDSSFGLNGSVIINFGTDNDDFANSLAIQEDGKIVVAGATGPAFGDTTFAVARLNNDGSLDNSFSGDGKATLAFDNAGINAIAVQADGKILGVGSNEFAPEERAIAMARFNADGTPDGAFGNNGRVETSVGQSSSAAGLAIQPHDGKIVVSGSTAPGPDSQDLLVARYNTDGTLDKSNTFGQDGVATVDVNKSDYASAVIILPDTSIVAGGTTGEIPNLDFLLVRLEGDEPPATPAPEFTSGDVDCDGDIDSVDSLFNLREIAGLPVTAKCLAAGDVDCDGDIDTVDALFILRHVAALPVNLPQGCPAIGHPV